MSSHILTITNQRADYTMWLLTGIDNDQWDTGTFTDACYQGSRNGTDLAEPPHRVEPIRQSGRIAADARRYRHASKAEA